jgi:phosphoenolpyruvate carboxylase
VSARKPAASSVAARAEPRSVGTGNARNPVAREVRLLGALLGQVIAEQEGPAAFDLVERVRRRTVALRRAPDPAVRAALDAELTVLEAPQISVLARAFSTYFRLANLAEEKARVRALRRRARSAGRGPIDDTFGEAVRRLAEGGATPGDLEAAFAALRVEPVLTAHPTEARRRTVLLSLRRIYGLLDALDDRRLTPEDDAGLRRRLREEITILWRTADLRHARPTPIDEIRTAMVFFDATIFTATPALYRVADAALDLVGRAADAADGGGVGGLGEGPAADHGRTGTRPARVPAFLRWGTWIGGDRDGHPFVTAEVTVEGQRIYADHVLHGYEAVATRLMSTVSARPAAAAALPPGLARRLVLDAEQLPEAVRVLEERFPLEPYRRRFGAIAERLRRTRTYLTARPGTQAGRYAAPAALLDELAELRDALVAEGLGRVAHGSLQDFRWQVETFGFHLASLEVRQHSEVHRAALAALTASPPESSREVAPGVTAGEVLATFRAIAALQRRVGEEAIHRYVVSFTSGHRDVADLLRLAALAGDPGIPAAATGGFAPGTPVLDAVPLFESADALDGARGIMAALLDDPAYRAHLRARGDRQEVMLGYSDSSKESGYLAANWQLQRAQACLAALGRERGVELTIFHGRGGAVGRGGGPAHRAVLAAPRGAVSGRLKVTEQGEIVAARYANPALALRGLEQAASATFVTAFDRAGEGSAEGVADRRADPPPAWSAAMTELAATARDAYRALVWDDPAFGRVFAAATPIAQISNLNLGSRPAARGAAERPAGEGTAPPISSLRAIPWVFAWSQIRMPMPGWFGVGSALAAFEATHGRAGVARLRAMVEGWLFFRVLLQNAEVGLARSDPGTARRYLALAGADGVRIGEALVAEHARSVRHVTALLGTGALLGGVPELRRSVELRAPYLDPLSELQVLLLGRLAALAADDPARDELEALVGLTISGIAAGVGGTG